jgi:hypothetical protein
VSQASQHGEPQIPVDRATNQLVARFSRLYAEAGPEDSSRSEFGCETSSWDGRKAVSVFVFLQESPIPLGKDIVLVSAVSP